MLPHTFNIADGRITLGWGIPMAWMDADPYDDFAVTVFHLEDHCGVAGAAECPGEEPLKIPS